MVNRKRLIHLAQSLIRIDSQNPPGDESRIALFVKDYLKKFGLDSRVHEFKKNRANVIVQLNGKDNRRSLLVTPHLDTVPAGASWKKRPLCARIDKGRIYGLGSTDCKGNLASALEAISSLAEEKVLLGYRLIFAATADEESGSGLGLAPLLNKGILKPDAAVVLDADDFSIIVTQKGLIHLKVKIQGKRAHGAYPWRGVNAIDIAIDIIKEVKSLKTTYFKNKYLRPPTVNIGTIKGGDKVNIVADWCEFELDLRFLPGSRAQDLLGEIRKIIKKYSARFSVELEGVQEPYKIKEKHPLVTHLSAAMRKIKVKPKIKGSEGATVITFFQHKGIPAVATGFGSVGCAHTADEYAKIDNLYKGSLVLEEFLKGYSFT